MSSDKFFFLIFEKLDREVKIHAWLTKRIDQDMLS